MNPTVGTVRACARCGAHALIDQDAQGAILAVPIRMPVRPRVEASSPVSPTDAPAEARSVPDAPATRVTSQRAPRPRGDALDVSASPPASLTDAPAEARSAPDAPAPRVTSRPLPRPREAAAYVYVPASSGTRAGPRASAARGASGTPAAAINGALLDRIEAVLSRFDALTREEAELAARAAPPERAPSDPQPASGQGGCGGLLLGILLPGGLLWWALRVNAGGLWWKVLLALSLGALILVVYTSRSHAKALSAAEAEREAAVSKHSAALASIHAQSHEAMKELVKLLDEIPG
ncbi:MAG: hypothetical protein GX657_05840 [Chloroflexi bacterium]|nr:hypothetical protein [Chloroflexota bacterium]